MAAHSPFCARATGSQSYRRLEGIKKLRGYREVFAAGGPPPDPGRIFYTITDADVGKTQIRTTEIVIHVAEIMGRVEKIDVGRRLYRMPTNGGIPGQPVSWIWQLEGASQAHVRLARESRNIEAARQLADKARRIQAADAGS